MSRCEIENCYIERRLNGWAVRIKISTGWDKHFVFQTKEALIKFLSKKMDNPKEDD